MAARGIKLRRLEPTQINHYHYHGFRLRVEIVETRGDVPREVFVYRRHPTNPDTGVAEDEWLGVASAPDIAEYPINNPDEEKNLLFFRKDFIEVDVRSLTHVEEVWNLVNTEVCNLVAALDRLERLEVVDETWCGDPTPTSASSQSISTSA